MLLDSATYKKSKSLIVGVLYCPPDSSKYLSDNFELTFDEVLSTATGEGRETIIMGYINCDFSKRNDHRNVKNTLESNGLGQQIKEPKRITPETSTLIDIIATTNPEYVKSSIVLNSPLSDHQAAAMIRKVNCQHMKQRKVMSRKLSKYCREALQRDLQSISWENTLTQTNVNEACSVFKEPFLNVLNKHARIVERNVWGRDLPWLTNSIKKVIHEQDYYF